MRIDLVCGSLALLLAACADDPAGELQATTSRLGDTVVVTSSARISFLSAGEGELLGSVRATWVTPFVNPRGSRLARVNGGVVSFWEENVHTDRPTRTALVWRDLEEDSIAVLRRWDGPQWTDVGGRLIAHTELFPPLLVGAAAPDGRIAVGDGLSYCIEVGEPGGETVQRWCRDRPRVAVGEGIRNPALEGLDDSRRRATASLDSPSCRRERS